MYHLSFKILEYSTQELPGTKYPDLPTPSSLYLENPTVEDLMWIAERVLEKITEDAVLELEDVHP